ncbi:hypothetical protein J6590_032511 [Homalodisca vitripennis]|nr:hypothetical protein J6590_032511 [Homalodisca vitripennis]
MCNASLVEGLLQLQEDNFGADGLNLSVFSSDLLRNTGSPQNILHYSSTISISRLIRKPPSSPASSRSLFRKHGPISEYVRKHFPKPHRWDLDWPFRFVGSSLKKGSWCAVDREFNLFSPGIFIRKRKRWEPSARPHQPAIANNPRHYVFLPQAGASPNVGGDAFAPICSCGKWYHLNTTSRSRTCLPVFLRSSIATYTEYPWSFPFAPSLKHLRMNTVSFSAAQPKLLGLTVETGLAVSCPRAQSSPYPRPPVGEHFDAIQVK